MDYREELLTSFKNELIVKGYGEDDRRMIMNSFINLVNKYEITERTTALSEIDQSTNNLLNLYMSSLRSERYSIKTTEVYHSVLMDFYLTIGKPLLQANAFDLRGYLLHKEDSGCVPVTCNNYRMYIHAFYNWCVNENILINNPMTRVKRIDFEVTKEIPLTGIEIDTIRKSCNTLLERSIFEILLSSGLRADELCSLNRDDVDFNHLEINVKHGKGNKSRITYMSDVAALYLSEYLNLRTDSNVCLLMNRRGNRMTSHNLQRMMRMLRTESGVSRLHAHLLRKTFASNLTRRGVELHIVQILLGHASSETTLKHYVTIDNQVLRTAHLKSA